METRTFGNIGLDEKIIKMAREFKLELLFPEQ